MITNKAPEKIYFTTNENGTHYYTEGMPFEREYIEYIRTDVFIEKVCEYIRTHLWQSVDDDIDPIIESINNTTMDGFIKDFKRYLEE